MTMKATKKEQLQEAILRYKRYLKDCEDELAELEKKKWTPTEGELVEQGDHIFQFRGFTNCPCNPYLPDLNKLMIKRDLDDHKKPDWDGQFLVKNRGNQKWCILNEHASTWVQIGSNHDVVEWFPIGDDYNKVKEAWLKAKLGT